MSGRADSETDAEMAGAQDAADGARHPPQVGPRRQPLRLRPVLRRLLVDRGPQDEGGPGS